MCDMLRICMSVLQCVAVCCSVLQCVAVCCSEMTYARHVAHMHECVAVCCSVLQCVAVCCSEMTYVMLRICHVAQMLYDAYVISRICFLDGYCSTVQGLLDWFEVDLRFAELVFIQIDLRVMCVFNKINYPQRTSAERDGGVENKNTHNTRINLNQQKLGEP